MDLHRRALGRAGPGTFVLIQKYPKIIQQIGFFAAQAFALQTGQNHGLQLFCSAALPMLLQKLAMPIPAHKATIVLPAFTRSLPADGNTLHLLCHG
jgi:hypothetical protein